MTKTEDIHATMHADAPDLTERLQRFRDAATHAHEAIVESDPFLRLAETLSPFSARDATRNDWRRDGEMISPNREPHEV